MPHVRSEQHPVTANEVEGLVSYLQGGPTAEQEDPLVVVLVLVHRRGQGAAQDLLDHDAAESRQFLAPLPDRRRIRGWPDRAAERPGHGNGFQFCSTTQQTPAGGCVAGPRRQRLDGGWLLWTSTTRYSVGPENLCGP